MFALVNGIRSNYFKKYSGASYFVSVLLKWKQLICNLGFEKADKKPKNNF